MRRRLAIVALAAAGCAAPTRVPVTIDSSQDFAIVEVNNIEAGNTPTTLRLVCGGKGGAVYSITVRPSRGGPGEAQTKVVNACQIPFPGGATLFFDLGPVRVQPVSR